MQYLTLENLAIMLMVGGALATALGTIGNLIARLPWAWAATVGHVMSAVGVDVEKGVQAVRGVLPQQMAAKVAKSESEGDK